MKVLLDENIPHKLRDCLPQHEVKSVAYCGWGGLKNGELLKAAQEVGFDVLVTGDQKLEYQQNVTARNLAVVVLSAHHWPIIKHYIPEISAAVDRAVRGKLSRVNCGSFLRKRR